MTKVVYILKEEHIDEKHFTKNIKSIIIKLCPVLMILDVWIQYKHYSYSSMFSCRLVLNETNKLSSHHPSVSL